MSVLTNLSKKLLVGMKADMKKNEEIIEALAKRNEVSQNSWWNKPFYILTGASDWDCSSGNGRQDWSSWLLWDVGQGERGGEGALCRSSSACLDQARRKKERFLRLLYHCIKIAVEKQQNKTIFSCPFNITWLAQFFTSVTSEQWSIGRALRELY